MKKHIIIATAIMAASLAQATIVYQDNFDGDGLGTNTGIGGGAGLNQVNTASWSDTGAGDAVYSNNGGSGGFRAAMYSLNSFDLSGGFKLTVGYSASTVVLERFGFGLVRTDTDVSTAVFDGLFSRDKGANGYNIGLSISDDGGTVAQGLTVRNGSFATLSNAQTITAGSQTVELTVFANGQYSYSIDGAAATGGTVAGGLDLTQNYQFVAYAQDDASVRSLQSVTLETIPEPATLGLIAMVGGSLFAVRRIFII